MALSTKKLTFWTLGILAVLLAGGALAVNQGWINRGGDAKAVDLGKSDRRTIVQEVSASGRIQPEEEVIIRPDVSGEIIELNVREGDFVRENEVLVRIKQDIYQARIDELNASLLIAKSRYEQARSGLLQAEAEYLKNKELYDQDLLSELQFLQIKNNYEGQQANVRAAEYQIESAEASLRRAQEELAQTVIRAPKDGTITRLSIEQGERVLGNSQMAGTEMMRIARMDQMEIMVDVNENDIVNVTVGDSAALEVDSYPDRLFDGVVTEIANSADVQGAGSAEQVTNYKVKIRVTTPHNLDVTEGGTEAQIIQASAQEVTELAETPSFKPGMSATVDIRTMTAIDVVSVPIQAVTVRNFAASAGFEGRAGGATDGQAPKEDFRRVVFVVDADTVKRVEVETGISDNTHIQILNGIAENEQIVIGPYRIISRELEEGDAVQSQETKKPQESK
jgi:HlyD family secretion protein